MISSKTRIRTQSELDQRAACFLEICQILDSLGINFFIQGGVLLGVIREGGFIKWDWDVEISVFASDGLDHFDAIVAALQSVGFTITKKNRSFEDMKINFFKGPSPEPTSFTIFGWWHDEAAQVFRRKKFHVPESFFSSLESVSFLGRSIKCPSQTEAYLEFQYGDWRTPKKTSNKNEYLSAKYSGEPKIKDSLWRRLAREARQALRNARLGKN
jgi:hypothetical protein